ncbi:MAG: glutamate N-acetyltransferase / amino-acid N-acetyltransferase, partial [Frankiaceae bacterium]|nr:glutamate N-acetyltransferase / amino-acid N-acetyltransferase [Frankiaceae bacterium]
MSVTAPRGFRASAVVAGIKPSGKPDVALVVNDGPRYDAAGVFTANRFPAAPVLWSRQVVAGGRISAVITNAGNANALTGAPGFQDTHATAEHTAVMLAHSAGEVAVLSTGIIGVPLPMKELLAGVENAAAALSPDGGAAAANAIRTTDTVAKQTHVVGNGWSVGGMAKGAGMLAPALATMLVVLTTDAVADAADLDRALRQACRTTFDRVDSDGCMSTNDTVLLLASGASGVMPSYENLAFAVQAACADLAAQLIADAEGASKEIAITVRTAASETDAVTAGRAIARSNLLKCALHGEDPNWGRVLAALGTTDAAFSADEVDVAINGVTVCRAGGVGDDRSLVRMTDRQIHIEVDLHAGDAAATI